MTLFKKREKILAIAAGLVVCLWIWMQLVLRPVIEYGHRLDAELAFKNMKIREANKILSGNTQSVFERELLQKLTSEGSAQEDMTRMNKEIERAAAASGLKVLEIKPQSPSKNVGWFEIKVSIAFEGSWKDVVHFLYQLETADKPLLVKEMSLETSLPQQIKIRGRFQISRLFAMNSAAAGK